MKPTESNDDAQLPVAERIAYLIAGFLRGTLTEAEHDELDAWVVASDDNTRLFEELTDEAYLEAGIDQHRRLDREGALQKIKEDIGLRPARRPWHRSLGPYLVAATLLAAVVSLYLFTKETPGEPTPPVAQHRPPATSAGHDQAVLTLASGRTIILDGNDSGVLAREGGIQVTKGADGALVYQGTATGPQFHTVSIPRGGHYKLVLADGSHVWLNAESSLRFPASFSGNSREVELWGEGYFDVAKNAARPFRVQIQTPTGTGGQVEVLGTQFNINAYEGAVRTTLIEGSVRVEKGSGRVVLKPGEQAIGGPQLTVVRADLQKEVAWKEGLFRFRDASIQEIAAQITRWYDVEVEYRGAIPYHFNATLRRDEPLSSLLATLEATQRVRFSREGKKLIIEP